MKFIVILSMLCLIKAIAAYPPDGSSTSSEWETNNENDVVDEINNAAYPPEGSSTSTELETNNESGEGQIEVPDVIESQENNNNNNIINSVEHESGEGQIEVPDVIESQENNNNNNIINSAQHESNEETPHKCKKESSEEEEVAVQTQETPCSITHLHGTVQGRCSEISDCDSAFLPHPTCGLGAKCCLKTITWDRVCTVTQLPFLQHFTRFSFIQCVHGISHLMRCPHGLVWNQERSYCDWA